MGGLGIFRRVDGSGPLGQVGSWLDAALRGGGGGGGDQRSDFLGFDTESKPTVHAQVGSAGADVLQLATPEGVLVVHLSAAGPLPRRPAPGDSRGGGGVSGGSAHGRALVAALAPVLAAPGVLQVTPPPRPLPN